MAREVKAVRVSAEVWAAIAAWGAKRNVGPHAAAGILLELVARERCDAVLPVGSSRQLSLFEGPVAYLDD